MLSEAVCRLLLVTIVSGRIIVSILFPNQFSLLIIEQLNVLVDIGQPRVFESARAVDTLVRIDLKQLSDEVPCIRGNLVLQAVVAL